MRLCLTAIAVLAACLPATLNAQGNFPERPITITVPFPPGGVADQSARPVAATMERLLKQPVVVANKPAAAGAVGMAFVANARPDGYNLVMALSSISIIPEADKLFGRAPAYRTDQLKPIALFTADPTVLVVSADSPWHSVKDLVEDAKKRPNGISYSSSGVYGTLHVAMAMFATAADIQLRHVPFSGGGPALTAILGKNVDATDGGPGVVLPQIKAGKLRALASWGAERLPVLPDVPTFKELGYADVEFYIWSGLFVPAATPEPVMTKLRDTARAVVADDEFKAIMTRLDTPIAYRDAPEFQTFWDADAKRLAAAVQKIGRVEEPKN
jgi:tripartite-type tricarboxylate transporter receptor subunit TctC